MKVRSTKLGLTLGILTSLTLFQNLYAQSLEVNVGGGRWILTSDSRKHMFVAPFGSNGQWNWALGTTFFKDGSLGVGTVNANSTYKLLVNGKVRAKEVRVDTNWADFVFENDYALPSLSEVEQHIALNKHLPGIPSAAEVEAEGVELGTISSKLLQKIEELTLYVIAQEKRLQIMESELQTLKVSE